MHSTDGPQGSYGVLQRDQRSGFIEEAMEQIARLGYAVVDSGYTEQQIANIGLSFSQASQRYTEEWGAKRLEALNEHHVIRALLTHGGAAFSELALNSNVLAVVRGLIKGRFILTQQNGVINPPQEGYGQGAWHRDLPYQHFTSSHPLAINALFCVDDFTVQNGTTYVVPASHRFESFPSEAYIRRHAVPVEARAGQFIVLDAMTFHGGGFNRSSKVRRAVNHVYTIPFFRQQISIPPHTAAASLTEEQRQILGFGLTEPRSVEEYLDMRQASMKIDARSQGY